MTRPRLRRRERPAPTPTVPFVVALLLLSALLYSVYGQRQAIPLSAGEPSPETFVAPSDLQVADPLATERRRQAAREQVPPITSVDDEAQELVLSAITAAGLSDATTTYLIGRYRDPNGVRPAELDAVVEEAVARAPADRRRDARLVLEQRLIPTASVDEALTEAARDAAARAVQPVLRRLNEGDVIVEAGEAVSEEQLRALQAVGLYDPRTRQLRQRAVVLMGCLLVGALLALPAAYAARALRRRVGRRQFLFLVGLTLATLAVQRLALDLSSDFVFVLLAPLLVATLLGEVAALLWAAWLAMAVGLMVPGAPLQSAAAVLVGGLAATLLAGVVRNRVALLIAGTAGGLVSGLTLVFLQLMNGGVAPLPAATDMVSYLGGGVLAGIVALGLVPLAEGTFDFLTDFRLVELSSPQSPLQQKLVLEAPGTYQHSQIIANLVEQAVGQIGGNALLARVGAMYHDVGKLRRPQFFAENQTGGENPHDRLSPHLSYLIITSHVRDGVEMLRRFDMPPALEPFVAEHHGTTVLAYFYKRALEDTDRLDELNFRYPGPKPRTKETAVLMLADAVESASRSLAEPTQGSIRAMIDRLIEQRLQDDQLSESPLNFRDLDTIANTFERVLTASLHRRVRYPSAEEIKGLSRGGDPRRDRAVSGA
ncbi:MAG: HDIG domain-containing protein [Deinococcus-Thermus bacterium]|nr:HDIG domain-containing protein [Deinococcota bacterium]